MIAYTDVKVNKSIMYIIIFTIKSSYFLFSRDIYNHANENDTYNLTF